ncbi:MAG: RNA 3'-terminal phosphate cyclase, partial [Candidatus Thorarchaeota archaeon]
MIEIDGAFGEGGGQILRTSIALSALTMQPVSVYNIRARRPKPGLKRQHLAGLEVLAQLVSADVRGFEVGSTRVEFTPRERKGGHFRYDVGTAGS